MSRKVDGVIYGKPGPARDGGVFVMSEKCATCIFHAGNLMHLNPGTVQRMKRDADKRGSCIICHEGMDSPEAAVCRGYFDNHKSHLLELAERMGVVKSQEPKR